jgi:PPP family 3-phenylpropionic acid transporter
MLDPRIISFLYFVSFSAFGVAIPYLPVAMKAIGFSQTTLGWTLAAGLVIQMSSPPFWGYVADQFGSGLALIGLASAAAALGMALCALANGPSVFLLGFMIYCVARTPVSALLDGLALSHPAVRAARFGTVRRWGSMGFLIAALLTGQVLEFLPRGGIPALAGLGWLATFALVLAVRSSARANVIEPVPLGALYRQRRLWLFLGLAAVHNACETPFDSFFANYMREMKVGGAWIGYAWAGGVLVEVGVMTGLRRIIEGLGPRRLLLIAYLAGAVRWVLTSLLTTGPALAAVQLLHGVSFGAFFGASVVWMDRIVPDSLKSSSQAILAAVVWGLGGVMGQLVAGPLYDHLGGRGLFAVAGATELVPLLGLMMMEEPPPKDPGESRVTARVPVSKTEASMSVRRPEA